MTEKRKYFAVAVIVILILIELLKNYGIIEIDPINYSIYILVSFVIVDQLSKDRNQSKVDIRKLCNIDKFIIGIFAVIYFSIIVATVSIITFLKMNDVNIALSELNAIQLSIFTLFAFYFLFMTFKRYVYIAKELKEKVENGIN